MKFKIARSTFIEALKGVQNIVAGKTSLPVIQNVLLEAEGNELKLTTTDLDISIRWVCECEVLEKGSTTLPVKLLFSSISTVEEGEVCVEVDSSDKATIKAGSAKFKISGISSESFPVLPSEDVNSVYKISEVNLHEMMRKVSYAASQDDTRKTLKGVLMSFKDEKLTVVATDGRRLALTEMEIEFPKDSEIDIVLPSKAVTELLRSMNGKGEVNIKVEKSQICFSVGNLQMFSKLIEDTYPNYRQVIPADTAEKVIVDRLLLLNALDRARVMSMDESHSTKLIFETGRLIVTSAASDIGEAKDEVPIKYAGESIEIMFNPSYVMDPLKVIDEDEISINFNNSHSPAVIKCSSPFLYVLMPLRVS